MCCIELLDDDSRGNRRPYYTDRKFVANQQQIENELICYLHPTDVSNVTRWRVTRDVAERAAAPKQL